ncbi:MAG: hypothetical protein GY769_24655 [bacterium]|nr:hypothetical protein [bacterium]
MTHRAPRPAGGPSLHPAATAALALVLMALGGAHAQDESTVEVEYALKKSLAEESLLLDAAAGGDLIVAVGERGHILYSHDQGSTWQQADSVPTRAMLTAVFLHDDQLGWAVGHDATILRTRDGGANWELVYSAPEEQLPLLDVRFDDADNGVAIGAYGYFLTTSDGGDSWTFVEMAAATAEENLEVDPFAYDEGGDYHLNHLARSESGRLYIAAEAGTVYRSDDEGQSWTTLPSPYEGSFFSSLPLDDDSLLIFGLRGHLFRSDDAGDTWEEMDSGTQAMLTDGVRLDDGTVVLIGLEGTILVSRDGGSSFSLKAQPDRQGYSSVLPMPDGGLILFGEFGATILPAATLGDG